MGLAIGQIIGSGVMVLTGIVAGITGRGVPYAFILGAVLSITLTIPMILLASTIPSSGVGYNSVKRLVGPKAGFLYVGMFILSQVLIATFAKGFASYFCAIFTGANETVVTMVALVSCTLINLVGLQSSAKAQNIMIVLLTALLLFIGFGLPQVNWSSLAPTMENVMPNGFQSFYTGAVLLSFACGGAGFVAENGDDIEDAPHTIPKVIILSSMIVAVFYAFVGIVAVGVLPIETVADQNLTLVARKIFPAWMYYVFVIGGTWFALLSTLNGTLSWVTRSLQAAAKDGWLPTVMAQENKYGIPKYLLFVFFVMGAFPILTGMDMNTISNMGIGTDMVSSFLAIFACWNLPKKVPEQWKKSTFRMSDTALHILLLVLMVLVVASSYVNFSSLDAKSLIGCGIYMVVLVIYTVSRHKTVQRLEAEKKEN